VTEKITVHEERINSNRELMNERIDNLSVNLERLESNDRAIMDRLETINNRIK
jgi:hypothetical protein